MYQENGYKNPFMGYEYKEIITSTDQVALLVDCYENFGWVIEEGSPYEYSYHHTRICMMRDRKLINKMELTRLLRTSVNATAEVFCCHSIRRKSWWKIFWYSGFLELNLIFV